jgi:hypothetical protein
MRFDEHPTWRMLEEGKKSLKWLATSNSIDHDVFKIIVTATSSLINLQIELENQIIEEMGDE